MEKFNNFRLIDKKTMTIIEKLTTATELVNMAHKENKNQFISGQIELIAMNLYVIINNIKSGHK